MFYFFISHLMASFQQSCQEMVNIILQGQLRRAHSPRKNLVFQLWLSPGAIIRDGDRKRGFHASPCVVPKNLFLEKIAPPFTS